MKKWFLIGLMLALPLTGAAAQENTVVALPTVAPLAQVEVSAAVDYTSDSLKEYYALGEAESAVDEQMPRMSAAEGERAAELLKEYQAGKRPAENALNKMENAVIGVYTLRPEDYQGETLYTLLPLAALTDEQILEVIDAFAQCGQTFDPDALSYRNCMRGGGIESSRFFQEDERTRRGALRDLYIRQGITAKTAFTPLASDDGVGLVTLDPKSYGGLETFLLLPYRQMTDDELLSYVIYSETGDPTQYGNYAAYEKQLRLELARLLGAPLVMARHDESMADMGDFSVRYGGESVYYAAFQTADGAWYCGYLDVDANRVVSASLDLPAALMYSDLHLDPFDGQWLTAAKDFVSQIRGDSMAVAAVESRGETAVQDAGYGVLADVLMADGSAYEMKIPYQTGTVSGFVSYDTAALDPDMLYAMLYE